MSKLFDTARIHVDRVAKRVVMPGIHYDLPSKTIPPTLVHSETPIPTVSFSGHNDLTGTKCGRMTVIGNNGKTRWVCRCACGRYELRKAKSVLNPNNYDMCHACRRLVTVKRHLEYVRTGENRKSYSDYARGK
jgi:hypothetical protein